jgi:hypothetical protein
VESTGKWLGIDEIRNLNLWARYAPVSGKYRVALLGPAERLTPEAANALLKLLEEVPALFGPNPLCGGSGSGDPYGPLPLRPAFCSLA